MKNKLYILFFPIISFVFLLIFSSSTSILYNSFTEGDSAIFMLIGKAVLHGKILYKDIFDHKGPILFFIEALGQFIIPGKKGIFLLQFLNLTLVLFFLRKLALLFIKKEQIWIVILCSLIFLALPISGGNITEEYNLLFLIIPFYLGIKDFTKKSMYPIINTFIYGICFSIIIFTRLTNVAPLAALLLTIAIFLIVEKRWTALLKHIGMFLFSFTITTIFISLYFYFNDALYDMFYGTFLFNFKYASVSIIKYVWGHIFGFLYGLITLLFVIFTAYQYYKSYNNIKLFTLCVITVLFSFIVINSGKLYLHYQIINLVIIALAISMALKNLNDKKIRKKQKKIYIVILCLLCVPYVYFLKDYIILTYQSHKYGISAYNYPKISIPESEKNNVIGYNVDAGWYLYENIIPCFKYFTIQDWWGIADPNVLIEFNKMIKESPPIWIITINGPLKNQELKVTLEDNYDINTYNQDYIVYKKNSD